MSTQTNKPTTAFWIIGVVALLWNAMGVIAYISQVGNGESFRAQYTQEQLVIIDNLPSWYMPIFAIAVFASVIGCILLLLRKKWAKPVFLIALLAVLIQSAFNIFVNEGKEYYGTFEYVMLLIIPLLSIYLYWYSDQGIKKGWLT